MNRYLIAFIAVIVLLAAGVIVVAELPVSPTQQHVEQAVPDAQIAH